MRVYGIFFASILASACPSPISS